METFRVLFVDDEEELVSAIVERLELRNIAAYGATSGVEAMRIIEDQEFDIAVLDVRMPGLSGLEMLQHLKRDYPDVQVILLSGHGSTLDVEEGLRLGAFDYLQKPVDIEQLVEIMRNALSASREGESSE